MSYQQIDFYEEEEAKGLWPDIVRFVAKRFYLVFVIAVALICMVIMLTNSFWVFVLGVISSVVMFVLLFAMLAFGTQLTTIVSGGNDIITYDIFFNGKLHTNEVVYDVVEQSFVLDKDHPNFKRVLKFMLDQDFRDSERDLMSKDVDYIAEQIDDDKDLQKRLKVRVTDDETEIKALLANALDEYEVAMSRQIMPLERIREVYMRTKDTTMFFKSFFPEKWNLILVQLKVGFPIDGIQYKNALFVAPRGVTSLDQLFPKCPERYVEFGFAMGYNRAFVTTAIVIGKIRGIPILMPIVSNKTLRVVEEMHDVAANLYQNENRFVRMSRVAKREAKLKRKIIKAIDALIDRDGVAKTDFETKVRNTTFDIVKEKIVIEDVLKKSDDGNFDTVFQRLVVEVMTEERGKPEELNELTEPDYEDDEDDGIASPDYFKDSIDEDPLKTVQDLTEPPNLDEIIKIKNQAEFNFSRIFYELMRVHEKNLEEYRVLYNKAMQERLRIEDEKQEAVDFFSQAKNDGYDIGVEILKYVTIFIFGYIFCAWFNNIPLLTL